MPGRSAPSARRRRSDCVADGAYAWLLPGVDSFGTWLARLPAPLQRAAARSGPVRVALLFVASTRRRRVAVVRVDPGWRTLLLLRAVLGRRRKLVVLQFIRHPLPGRWWPPIDRWAVRHAMLVGHVLSPRERERYAAEFGLSVERFVHIPWAWRAEPATRLPEPAAEPSVLCGGRAFCDWPTLFEAQAGAGWPLTVVCSARELEQVRALAAGTPVRVYADLEPGDYAAPLRRATVAVIAMREAGISQGQIRLMEAPRRACRSSRPGRGASRAMSWRASPRCSSLRATLRRCGPPSTACSVTTASAIESGRPRSVAHSSGPVAITSMRSPV
jgi:hypothetical protein